jgi:hypothetical protein
MKIYGIYLPENEQGAKWLVIDSGVFNTPSRSCAEAQLEYLVKFSLTDRPFKAEVRAFED